MTDLGNSGNEYAQVKLGFEYLKGENIPRDIEMAREWFTKASEQGNELAQDVLLNLNNTSGGRRSRSGALDKALSELKKSMNEEYKNTMKNIREYELDMQQQNQISEMVP